MRVVEFLFTTDVFGAVLGEFGVGSLEVVELLLEFCHFFFIVLLLECTFFLGLLCFFCGLLL